MALGSAFGASPRVSTAAPPFPPFEDPPPHPMTKTAIRHITISAAPHRGRPDLRKTIRVPLLQLAFTVQSARRAGSLLGRANDAPARRLDVTRSTRLSR